MISIAGRLEPNSYEEAIELAQPISVKIDQARQEVEASKRNLVRVCVESYPVGSRVRVNIAAHCTPLHEVISVNENGWMILRNCTTGTERGMMADDWRIRPSLVWYVAKAVRNQGKWETRTGGPQA